MRKNAVQAAMMIAALASIASAGLAREHPIRDKIRAAREARAAKLDVKKGTKDKSTLVLNHDGLAREFIVQAPSKRRGTVPVVIALHGATRSASDIFDRTSWPQIARRENFLLVAPTGINNQWNDGRGDSISGKVSTADDIGFLNALIATLIRDHNADPSAIYLTGVSNGGMMTIRYSCESAPSVAAVAPVIAAMPKVLEDQCRKAGSMAALFIPGTADPVITYDGKPSALLARRGDVPPMLSVPETIDLWRDRNNCDNTPQSVELQDRNKRDSSTVTRITYRPCRSGASLELLRINGGGHQQPAIPPAAQTGPLAKMLGPQNGDIDGPEEIWQFFKGQAKR